MLLLHCSESPSTMRILPWVLLGARFQFIFLLRQNIRTPSIMLKTVFLVKQLLLRHLLPDSYKVFLLEDILGLQSFHTTSETLNKYFEYLNEVYLGNAYWREKIPTLFRNLSENNWNFVDQAVINLNLVIKKRYLDVVTYYTEKRINIQFYLD